MGVFFTPKGIKPSKESLQVTPFDIPYLTVSHRDPLPPRPLRRKSKFSNLRINMSSVPGADAPRTDEALPSLPMPGISGRANGPVGNLLKGAVDDKGKLKDAALLVGIKLDLEAEVHLTARVRGDVVVGLY